MERDLGTNVRREAKMAFTAGHDCRRVIYTLVVKLLAKRHGGYCCRGAGLGVYNILYVLSAGACIFGGWLGGF